MENLNRIIIVTYDVTYPIKTLTSSRNISWWKSYLITTKTEVRKLFNQVKQIDFWSRYKNALTTYNQVIGKEKRNNFRKLFEDIEMSPRCIHVL